MEIRDSSIYRDIQTVLESGVKPVHNTWTAKIHANGNTYQALKVISIDTHSDYEFNYSDEIIIKIAMHAGTFAKRIYPFQNGLEITLTKTPATEVTGQDDQDSSLQSERFTATMIDNGSPILESNTRNSPTEENLNLTDTIEIELQLVNKALEQLRMKMIGGIYRHGTTENTLKTILTNESKNINVDTVRIPIGVDMYPASNVIKRDHVVIPQGTRLVDLGDYIQNKCGGIYSAGLGCYFKRDHWYIAPCYDVTRYLKAKRKITVINVPAMLMPEVERTYKKDGDSLLILATGETIIRDDSEVRQLNIGNGVRFADASKIIGGFVETKDNKTRAKRGSNNTEVIAVNRPNKNNNVINSAAEITTNSFAEFSKLARNQGNVITMVWENSNASLLDPYSVVRILYLDGDIVKDVYGVLLKAHDYTQQKRSGLVETGYKTHTAMVFFTQRINK